jgi:hypothetical protein
MTRDPHDPFEYDVALSFAREDRAVAGELGALLRARDLRVYSEEVEDVELGGSDFVTHLAELYRTKARYCVILLSRHYPLKSWTMAERSAAQQHALRDANEYIFPVQLDDREVPGAAQTTGYTDLRQHSLEAIADLLEGKRSETRERSGPPPQSHDLRSGNVPSRQRPDDH